MLLRLEFNQQQNALKSLSDNDQMAVKEHFNTRLDDYDDLGDTLFGEVEDFK